MTTIFEFTKILDRILIEEFENNYTSAVGIVQYKNKWLLGLSTASDDRHNKWCFPGGHIKKGESPRKAVEREVYEETGIKCKAIDDHITLPSKRDIVFLHCKASNPTKLKYNSEFIALGWFSKNDMKGLKIHNNVKTLIDKVS